jgi:hypothetical protein
MKLMLHLLLLRAAFAVFAAKSLVEDHFKYLLIIIQCLNDDQITTEIHCNINILIILHVAILLRHNPNNVYA